LRICEKDKFEFSINYKHAKQTYCLDFFEKIKRYLVTTKNLRPAIAELKNSITQISFSTIKFDDEYLVEKIEFPTENKFLVKRSKRSAYTESDVSIPSAIFKILSKMKV